MNTKQLCFRPPVYNTKFAQTGLQRVDTNKCHGITQKRNLGHGREFQKARQRENSPGVGCRPTAKITVKEIRTVGPMHQTRAKTSEGCKAPGPTDMVCQLSNCLADLPTSLLAGCMHVTHLTHSPGLVTLHSTRSQDKNQHTSGGGHTGGTAPTVCWFVYS